MNNLTAEQLKKIEENKRIALQKRQKVQNAGHTSKIPFNQNFASIPDKEKYGKIKPSSSAKNTSSAAKTETAVLKLQSSSRFCVDMVFHQASIDVMKTIPGRVFDNNTKMWTFPISEHDNVVKALRPLVGVTPLPSNVVECLNAPEIDIEKVDIDKIDVHLRSMLLPFQVEGVKFGISRNGRCLIADDMGLGKTIQALGIAHYYIEAWPLLIVCPSSMRFPWEESIIRFLPSVDPFSIVVMTTATDDFHTANIVICSYDLLKTCLDDFKRKKFGVIIFDESHNLKTAKSARAKAALELVPLVKHLLLLSGTPALSRPLELFNQIHAIDRAYFPVQHSFGLRYCDGKKGRFGWDYNGSSNSAELDIVLRKKFMLRRLKAEVQMQLPTKVRKRVVLNPALVKAVPKQVASLGCQIGNQKVADRYGKMFEYYNATAIAKLPAVLEYIGDKLETHKKMLIFAHHAHVLDGLSVLLVQKRIKHIRIDGTTSSECRASFTERFQTDPETRVAVLSIKAANCGLTLTAAQLVIFAELYWNPGELTQAEDRAHRIGQSESVCVEYLIAKGTSDDQLWQLLESKLKVLNSVGLSKDSFRNAGTEHIADKKQPLITEAFKNVCGDELTDLTATQINMCVDADFDSLEEAFVEDDLFDQINLDNIEDEYSSKRQKLDS